MGWRVGLLDADIYGPSIPTMLGVTGRPVSSDGKTIEPLARFGIKLMSIGFLLEDPKAAVIWRGPMLHGALQQFMKDVTWGELDFLVMDLPPGTGRRGADALAEGEGDRRGDRDHAAGGGHRRRLQVGLDVQEGEHPGARRGREHELVHRLRGGEARALRQRRRAGGGGLRRGAAARAGAARPQRARVGRQGDAGGAGRAAERGQPGARWPSPSASSSCATRPTWARTPDPPSTAAAAREGRSGSRWRSRGRPRRFNAAGQPHPHAGRSEAPSPALS